MNSMHAVTTLAVYLSKGVSEKVFKYEKTANYNGEYIVVNALPFVFGKVHEDNNKLNLNLHVPDKSDGQTDTKRLSDMLSEITSLIPYSSDEEDVEELYVQGMFFSISSDSNAIKDSDNTHFINLKIKVRTN